MKAEYVNCLAEVTTQIRIMRESLPDVDTEQLAKLNARLAELDISDAKPDEVAKLRDAFALLAQEINQTMEKINDYCEELRADLADVDNHSHGVKAYVLAQHNK